MRRWPAVTAVVVAAMAGIGALFWSGYQQPANSGEPAAAADPPRPNVIVFLVDTLRADHLGVYGYDRDTSPVLDRWASGSTVFDNTYAPSSWTKPSMVTLFSGLDAISHGAEDRLDRIPADVPLLAERLKALGYSTFGAVTNPNVLAHWGFDRGFDVYRDLDSAGNGTPANRVTEFVEEHLDRLEQSQPFFLYLHVVDPHFPYQPPPPFDSRFPRSRAVPANMSVGRYDGEIAFVDAQFGRITELLGQRGLNDRSMTIFTSDHGEELWERGRLGHGSTLYEEVVRVPLLIRFPQGRFAGIRVAARTSLTDVFPTVLHALGESPGERLDGRDLAPLIQGSVTDTAERDLFLSLRTSGQGGHRVRGVLSGPFKYLKRTRPEANEALFDLVRDPTESKDISADEQPLQARLAKSLNAHLAQRSSGVQLRIVNAAAGEPQRAEALIQTSGDFTEVMGIRLEQGDGFDLLEDRRQLRLSWRLENRYQELNRGKRLVPDEDGIRFQVTPPDARIVVQQLEIGEAGEARLRVGDGEQAQAVPFAFHASDDAWRIRDIDDLLADAGATSGDDKPGVFLGVIRPPAASAAKPSRELLERLRSLGYLGGDDDAQ